MINPGYRSKVSRMPFNCEAGPMMRCPDCKRPLMEAIVEKLYIRCKRCGVWVYLEKKSQGDLVKGL